LRLLLNDALITWDEANDLIHLRYEAKIIVGNQPLPQKCHSSKSVNSALSH